MPTRGLSTNERLTGVEVAVADLKEYESKNWHKQAQDLQLLMQIPDRLTRIELTMVGKSEIEAAVEKALTPLALKQADHDKRLDTLEAQRNMLTGAKLLLIFLVQTFIAALTALAGAFEFTRGHP